MDINLHTMVRIETDSATGLPRDAECMKLFDSIQGNFVKEHGRDNALLLFLVFKKKRINDIKAHMAEIYNNSDLITSCNQQLQDAKRYSTWRKRKSPKPDFEEKLFVNFALTAKGYALLDRNNQLPNDPEGLFSKGLDIREVWDEPYKRDIHAMMLLALDHKNLPDLGTEDWAAVPEHKKSAALKKAAEIKTKWEKLATVTSEVGRTIYNKEVNLNSTPDDPRKPVEHFGYIDGISNPMFFEDELREWEESEGIPASEQKYNPQNSLAVVLTKDPNGGKYAYGSYLAFLKLEQDVETFMTLTNELTKKLRVDQELTQAYVMGRFQDGTPVLLQDRPQLGIVNNFNFSQDHEGMKCPVHAHIRKVNRRMGPLAERDLRIVRRGITYGYRAVRYDAKGDLILPLGKPKGPVGLLFMSYQDDISMFNRMFSIWAEKDNPMVGNAFDPIIAQGKEGQEQPWPSYGKNENFERFRFADVVTEKGGQYFFAPSIPYLKNLYRSDPTLSGY